MVCLIVQNVRYCMTFGLAFCWSVVCLIVHVLFKCLPSFILAISFFSSFYRCFSCAWMYYTHHSCDFSDDLMWIMLEPKMYSLWNVYSRDCGTCLPYGQVSIMMWFIVAINSILCYDLRTNDASCYRSISMCPTGFVVVSALMPSCLVSDLWCASLPFGCL